jgi:hypothetical protein
MCGWTLLRASISGDFPTQDGPDKMMRHFFIGESPNKKALSMCVLYIIKIQMHNKKISNKNLLHFSGFKGSGIRVKW